MSVRSLKTPRRKCLLAGGAIVLAVVGGIFFLNSGPDDPIYKGKRLSTWLDELSALGHPKDRDPTTEHAAAIRAIGTNGIPWMLSDLRASESAFHWRCNKC